MAAAKQLCHPGLAVVRPGHSTTAQRAELLPSVAHTLGEGSESSPKFRGWRVLSSFPSLCILVSKRHWQQISGDSNLLILYLQNISGNTTSIMISGINTVQTINIGFVCVVAELLLPHTFCCLKREGDVIRIHSVERKEITE